MTIASLELGATGWKRIFAQFEKKFAESHLFTHWQTEQFLFSRSLESQDEHYRASNVEAETAKVLVERDGLFFLPSIKNRDVAPILQ